MDSNSVFASVYLLRRNKYIYFWGQSQLKTCRKKILPKNKTNLFATNTEQIYFGQKQKQDILILEKTGQIYFGQKHTDLF